MRICNSSNTIKQITTDDVIFLLKHDPMTNSCFTILIALYLCNHQKNTEKVQLSILCPPTVVECDSMQSVNNEISLCIISPLWASAPTNLAISSTAKVKELKKRILTQWRLTDANLYYDGQMMNPAKKISYYGITKSGTSIQIYYRGMDIIGE